MINKNVINVENKKETQHGNFLNTFKSIFNLTVYADGEDDKKADDGGDSKKDDDSNKSSNTSSNTINYEDLIAKARKEEKDKLYPKIESLNKDVSKWTETCNKHLITIAEKEKEIEALETKLKSSGKDDSKEVKDLNVIIEDLKKQIEGASNSKVDEKAIEEKIKSEYEVKFYRLEQLAKLGEEVIPELVTGLTKEDIDKSIEESKKRYTELAEKIAGKSKSNFKVPASNVNTSTLNAKDFKIEDLAKLDPRSAEYKEFRIRAGLK